MSRQKYSPSSISCSMWTEAGSSGRGSGVLPGGVAGRPSPGGVSGAKNGAGGAVSDCLKDPIHVKLHFTRGQEITLIFEITFTPRLVFFRRVNYSTGSKIYSTGSKNYSTKGS